MKGATRWSEMSKALTTFIGATDNAGVGAGIGFFLDRARTPTLGSLAR